MSWIDGGLLAAILAVAAWRLSAGGLRPAWRGAAVALLAAACALQVLVEGFTWQFLAAYPLLAASAWPRRDRAGRALTWIGRLALVGLAGLALGPWILLPVPQLSRPEGPYAVGTEVIRWTDASRPELATPDPADRRGVVVQAFYPASPAPAGRWAAAIPYIDGLGRLPPTISLFPAFVFHRFGQIDTHAVPDAPLAPGPGAWPVIVFSPGYGAPRAFYTGLLTELASRGFVVLALDHPYEAGVTQLADGRVVGLRENLLPNDPDRHLYMVGQLDVRAADVRSLLDRLAEPGFLGARFAGRLALTRLAVVGHSFGGATAAAALDRDPRVVAAVNLDGTPYGDLPNHRLKGPFLVVQSDYAETHHSQEFLDGNGRLLGGAPVGLRYEIKGANHFSFTDAPMFFSPPGRWLVARIIGGEIGPLETRRASVEMLTAFLSGPLGGPPGDVAAAAARHPGVVSHPVTPTPAGSPA